MAKASFSQTNFNTGQVSPKLYGRVDVTKYQNALEVCENIILQPQGPMEKRAGFRYCGEAKTPSDPPPRLIPFQYSSNDGLIMELGNLYIRFWGIVSGVPGLVIDGTPVEVTTTYTSSQLDDIQYVQFGNVVYFVHPDVAPKKLTRVSNTEWTFEDVSFSPEPTAEAGYEPNETLTSSAATGTVTMTAGGNAFIDSDVGRQIVHSTNGGRAIITGYTSPTVVTADIINWPSGISTISAGFWYMDISPLVSVTPSGSRAGSKITITAASPTFKDATYDPGDVDNYILLHGGVCKILSVTSSTVVSCEVLKGLDDTAATENWSMEQPTWSAERGYPRAVALHEQRLVFGGTSEQPQTIWGSETGLLESFGVGPEDNDSYEFEIVSDQFNEIQWLIAQRELVIGTAGTENTLGGTVGPLTPSSAQQRTRSSHGSQHEQPINIDGEIVFIQKTKKKLRSFVYDFGTDGYTAEELTFLSENIVEAGLKEFAYANDLMFCILEDGGAVVGTFKREQEVLGWSVLQAPLEAASDTWQRAASGILDGEERIWTVVTRDGNNYIELYDDEAYMDSFSLYRGTSTTTISGLDHLEGRTVQITAATDAFPDTRSAHPDRTVSSGSITLQWSTTNAAVGLKYRMEAKTLSPELGLGGMGATQGQRQRWSNFILRVYNSFAPKINDSDDDQAEGFLPIRTPQDNMDVREPFMTGDLIYGSTAFDQEGKVTIFSEDPYPVNIAGVFGTMEANPR